VPKRSEEHLEARRRQIVDGARRAFAQHGYEGATVALLEKEIGLSRGAIFNYFPSKLELFYALAVDDYGRVLTTVVEQGYEAALREIAEETPEWIGVYLENARRLRTDADFRRRWKQRNPELEKRADEYFERLLAEGELRDDVPLEQLGRFVGLVADGVALQTGAGFPVDVEPMIGLLRDALAPRK
jgi:AcrR family transcriptional regulator